MKKGFELGWALVFILAIIGFQAAVHAQTVPAGGTQVQVKVCPDPKVTVVTSPIDHTSTGRSTISVEGKSKAGITIRIFNNGRADLPAAVITSSKFNYNVPLTLGLNSLAITVTNTCGQIHTQSISVYRTAPQSFFQEHNGVIWIIELVIIIILLLAAAWLLLLCRHYRLKIAKKAGRSQKRKK
jgi:hypothetical protein